MNIISSGLLSRWDCCLRQPFTGGMRSPTRCEGFVPKGQQISLTSVRKSDATSQNPFEDEDEDDHDYESDCENE